MKRYPVLCVLLLAVPAVHPQSALAPGRDAFGLTAEEKEILGHLSIEMLPDEQGGLVKTIRFTGVNVQIVNGLGATATANGHGNLVVGYNEIGNHVEDDRTGSHCVILGARQSYRSWGGLLAGLDNAVHGEFASVSGGAQNLALGVSSSVGGGTANKAFGTWASVSGGFANESVAFWSSIGGGSYNVAYGIGSSVSGGFSNHASGYVSSVSGGASSFVGGIGATVSGGHFNSAYGDYSSVSGGSSRSVAGTYNWAAGTQFESY